MPYIFSNILLIQYLIAIILLFMKNCNVLTWTLYLLPLLFIHAPPFVSTYI